MGRIQNSWTHSDELADFYLPQVEQFGISLQPHNIAYMGAINNDVASANVCVYPLGSFGVITAHRIHMKRDMPFYEHAKSGLCISTLSADSLALCPVVQPSTPKKSKNVAVFGQTESETKTILVAGSTQNAISLIVKPTWFKQSRHRNTALNIIEHVSEIYPDEEAHLLDALLTCIAPPFGGKLVDEKELVTQAVLVTNRALSWYEDLERAEKAAGTLAQARLVRTARQFIMRHLSEPLSLDTLAHDLLTSRSRLCAAFRQETNESLGSFITRMRMKRAEYLLSTLSVSIQKVARAVGYAYTSSFTVAFERTHGLSPSAWRRYNALASYSGTHTHLREETL